MQRGSRASQRHWADISGPLPARHSLNRAEVDEPNGRSGRTRQERPRCPCKRLFEVSRSPAQRGLVGMVGRREGRRRSSRGLGGVLKESEAIQIYQSVPRPFESDETTPSSEILASHTNCNLRSYKTGWGKFQRDILYTLPKASQKHTSAIAVYLAACSVLPARRDIASDLGQLLSSRPQAQTSNVDTVSRLFSAT